MKLYFEIKENKLICSYNGETLCVEPWGVDSIRVRAVQMGYSLENSHSALNQAVKLEPKIKINDHDAVLVNGKLTAKISGSGKIIFLNSNGDVLLEEFSRTRADLFSKDCSALEISGREFMPHLGGDYALTARFESYDNECLYGMGQYQQPYLNIKGCRLELAQRNSQASVPFVYSNRGYGFLWNNPAIGDVTFGKNITEWKAHSTKILDYWITAGDTPADVIKNYTDVTGRVPVMPEYGLGFWQCKLRYQTQDELLNIAREYKKRKLPLDVIVVDFFHWPKQGEWKFDPVYWPDPDAMVKELKEMGTELMVSVWPTVDRQSENFQEMYDKGYLVKTERGVITNMEFQGDTVFFDPTNPEARKYVWSKIEANYYSKGIKTFWLDEAEPEYQVYNFDNYRYYSGPNLQVGNIFPKMYARTFYEGMESKGQKNIVNLLRCAWAGSQRYGVMVWSGDIASSFSSMRSQLAAGLNMGIAGIPWWTTDIGGFHGGDPNDKNFQELFARWFAWGAFCPVMRLHGDREPRQEQYGTTGGATCRSGADNEVWSYGDEVYNICVKYMTIREKMRPYIRQLMADANKTGTPVMRPLFFDYFHDPKAWEVEDQYMFGPDLLIAPVMQAGMNIRNVYLPSGSDWNEYETGKLYNGGAWVECDVPLNIIPVFIRKGSEIKLDKR